MRISSLQRGLIGSSGDPLRVSTSGGCVSGGAAFNWSAVLRAQYDFENSGALGEDTTANNLDITDAGDGATHDTTNEKIGSGCVSFDGSTTALLYLADSSLPAGFPGKNSGGYQNFLVTGWYRVDGTGGTVALISKYYPETDGRSWRLDMVTGAEPDFRILLSSDGSAATVSYTFTVADGGVQVAANTWYHIGFYHDSTLDRWGLVVWDGSTKYSHTDVTLTTGINLGVAGFAIGACISSGGTDIGHMDGKVDHVKIYSWADGSNPTQAEILTQIDADRRES
jgi:hypothetical protein